MGLSALKSVFRPRWLMLAMGCLFGVLIVTHIPQEFMTRMPQGSYIDKIEHMLAYGAVTLLFLLSLRWPARPQLVILLLLGLAVVGGLDEVTQPWVNRIASTADFVADLIGVVVVAAVFLLVMRCRKKAGGQSCPELVSEEIG
jgi:VanZ family protein